MYLKIRLLRWFLFASILIPLLALAACQLPGSPEEIPATAGVELDSAATVQALEAEIVALKTGLAEAQQAPPTLPPTSTPIPVTPTETPTPTFIGPITLPSGVVSVTNELAPGYVFVLDPEIWLVDESTTDDLLFLLNKEIGDCRVDIAGPPSTPVPDRYFYESMGGRYWVIREYEDNSNYELPEFSLSLSRIDDEDCLPAQEALLAAILAEEEYAGAPTQTAVATPSERPSIGGGFTCTGSLPVRLRVGDRALITAGFLWLRKEPKVEEATEIRIYGQYAPVLIEVVGGPACVEANIFWQVTVTELGEGGEQFSGYMAESDGENYYLDVWYPES